jgi:hypothetical protein
MTTAIVAQLTAEEHAKRFKETHAGKGLSDEQIEDICAAIHGAKKACGEEVASYTYKVALFSALFYINVEVNCDANAPANLRKHFTGSCGGIAFPGASLFESCELHTCDPWTFEDIFYKQKAIEVDAEAITCFIRFFDKDHHLLGWLWGAGAGTVIGVMGGTGKWGDGPL